MTFIFPARVGTSYSTYTTLDLRRSVHYTRLAKISTLHSTCEDQYTTLDLRRSEYTTLDLRRSVHYTRLAKISFDEILHLVSLGILHQYTVVVVVICSGFPGRVPEEGRFYLPPKTLGLFRSGLERNIRTV